MKIRTVKGKEVGLVMFLGEYDPKKFKKAGNDTRIIVKPSGGLWACPFVPDKGSKWIEWCIDNDFVPMTGDIDADSPVTFIRLKDKAKFVLIDSFEDLANVLSRFEYRPKDAPDVVFELNRYINYEKLFSKFDGIYLTDRGESATRLTQPSMYGWDVETVFVSDKSAVKATIGGHIESRWIDEIKNKHDELIRSMDDEGWREKTRCT